MPPRLPLPLPRVRSDRPASPWRWLSGILTTLVIVLLPAVVTTPAHAAGTLTVTKSLASGQGSGFTSPNIFEVGANVTYRMTAKCSSLTTGCGITTITDHLDPALTYVDTVWSSTGAVHGQNAVGQDVTFTIGDGSHPFPAGTTLEFFVTAKVAAYPTGNPKAGTAALVDNSATATSTDAPPASTGTVQIKIAEPAQNWGIRKRVVSPSGNPAVGMPVTYRLEYTNTSTYGQPTITHAVVVDTYPADATVSNAAEITAAGGSIDGIAHTITWTLTAPTAPSALTCGTPCSMAIPGIPAIVLTYPGPTFKVGDNPVNQVTSDLTFDYGAVGHPSGQATVVLATPATAQSFTKDGTGSASRTGAIWWTMRYQNTGNTLVTGIVLEDDLPPAAKVAGRHVPGYRQYVSDDATQHLTFEWYDGATWTPLTPDTHGTVAIPDAATRLRVTADQAGPNEWVRIPIQGTVVDDGTVVVGDTITNCATYASTSPATGPSAPSCHGVPIVVPSHRVQTFKGHQFVTRPGQTAVNPGEEFYWGIGVGADGELPATSVSATDLLPPQVEYVGTVCSGVTYSADPNAAVSTVRSQPGNCDSSVPQPTVSTAGVPTPGMTRLVWDHVDISGSPIWGTWEAYWVVIKVRMKPATPVGTYTNTAYGQMGPHVNSCKVGGTLVTDTADVDHDGDTTETFCSGSDSVPVLLAAVVEMTKWSKGTDPHVNEATGLPDSTCPDWEGYTYYPCVASTKPNTDFSYRLKLDNVGNATATDFVAYDILPYVGDTGVSEDLLGTTRLTEWRPVLTGPVVIESAPAGAAPLVEYSLSSTPCRPELAKASGSDPAWNAGCDNSWLTAGQVTSWSSVRSYRVRMFRAVSGVYPGWAPMTGAVVRVPMHAPLSAPASTVTPLDLSVAWNSAAHHESRLNGDNSTVSLEAAEPRKVGIVVPSDLPPMVSVGDTVWYDVNRDGRQDGGEGPASGVTVTLSDATTHAVLDETTTDAQGHYWFINLTPATRYEIVVTPPTGYGITIPHADGATAATDSDADPRTKTMTVTSPASGLNHSGAPDLTDDPRSTSAWSRCTPTSSRRRRAARGPASSPPGRSSPGRSPRATPGTPTPPRAGSSSTSSLPGRRWSR